MPRVLPSAEGLQHSFGRYNQFLWGDDLSSRKLVQFPATVRVPATMSATADVIRFANQIMVEIDMLRLEIPA